MNTTDDFPYKRQSMTPEEVNTRFNNLKKYQFKLIRQPYSIRNISGNWYNDKSLKYNNLLIVNNLSDYLEYNLIGDYFNDPLRMTYRRYDRQITPLEYWNQNKQQVRLHSLQKYGNMSAYSLRESIYELAGECSEFRPTVLMSLIKMYKAKRVLDPAAGSGSRLIAAIAADVDYTGVDPNTQAHEVYKEIIEYFKPNKEPTLIQSPFEDCELPQDKTYDLVMTSPPYFTLETYSSEETQSTSRYPTLDQWFDNFLMPTLNKSWSVLDTGGHMCININDIFKEAAYCQRMVEAFNGAHTEATFLGVISYSEFKNDKPRSPQPIFCWEKK